MHTTRFRAALAAVAATLAVGATVPAASHAAIRTTTATTAPAKTVSTPQLAVHVLVHWPNSQAYGCGIAQTAINDEIDQAQAASDAGNYADIAGHLKEAAEIAAGAESRGCGVTWLS